MSSSTAPSACLVCFEVAFSSLDNKLLTSRQCGHKVCRSCLQSDTVSSSAFYSPSCVVSKASLSGNGAGSTVVCPLCQERSSLADWEDRENDEALFDQEKLVRQRVMSVYNMTRGKFDNTPQYNDYLEHREEIVFTLAFGSDEGERKRFQEELEAYEIEHQKQIVECRQNNLKQEKEWIRDIVQKEGVFFERAQMDYNVGFRMPSVKLVHTLQRRHPELFMEDDTETGSGYSSANDQKRSLKKKGGDMPTVASIGTGNQPKPLDANLVYGKLRRRPHTDKAAMLRACGLSKDTIGRRVMEELWGGLTCNITIKRGS